MELKVVWSKERSHTVSALKALFNSCCVILLVYTVAASFVCLGWPGSDIEPRRFWHQLAAIISSGFSVTGWIMAVVRWARGQRRTRMAHCDDQCLWFMEGCHVEVFCFYVHILLKCVYVFVV